MIVFAEDLSFGKRHKKERKTSQEAQAQSGNWSEQVTVTRPAIPLSQLGLRNTQGCDEATEVKYPNAMEKRLLIGCVMGEHCRKYAEKARANKIKCRGD